MMLDPVSCFFLGLVVGWTTLATVVFFIERRNVTSELERDLLHPLVVGIDYGQCFLVTAKADVQHNELTEHFYVLMRFKDESIVARFTEKQIQNGIEAAMNNAGDIPADLTGYVDVPKEAHL